MHVCYYVCVCARALLYAAHTSLALPHIALFLLLGLGLEEAVGAHVVPDLQERRGAPVLPRVDTVTCTQHVRW